MLFLQLCLYISVQYIYNVIPFGIKLTRNLETMQVLATLAKSYIFNIFTHSHKKKPHNFKNTSIVYCAEQLNLFSTTKNLLFNSRPNKYYHLIVVIIILRFYFSTTNKNSTRKFNFVLYFSTYLNNWLFISYSRCIKQLQFLIVLNCN